MDAPEPPVHSFVVRVWLEDAGADDGCPSWRGHVTHLPEGTRRYVRDFAGITGFIAGYVEQMGVPLGARWRVRRALARLMGRPVP